MGPARPGYGALLPRSSRAGADAVVLVSQNDSLYAVPAAHLAFEAPGHGGSTALAPVPGQWCDLPVVDRLVQQPDALKGDSPGTALAIVQQQQQQGQRGSSAAAAGSGTAEQCRPAEADTCAVSMLGVFAVHQASSSGLISLPAAANESAAAAATQQAGGTSLGWLLLIGGAVFGATAAAFVLILVGRRAAATAAQQQQQQREQQQKEQAAASSSIANGTANGTPTTGAGAGSKLRRRAGAGSKRQQQQMSNRLKGLMQQAAAEDDPAQPAPQRQPAQGEAPAQQEQQQQQQRQQDDGLPSTAAVTAGLADPAMRRRTVEDGVILVGRMRVGPDVLGYGSGGTVVFAGELDGRPVAVKRMLRQFFEMARKEIDALILADEHPNIVRCGLLAAAGGAMRCAALPSNMLASTRLPALIEPSVAPCLFRRCFAMEEDHEFVYLALERCKATLSDMMQARTLCGLCWRLAPWCAA